MSADNSALRSRRAILASALGGLGAVVAAKLANPVNVSAATGDPLVIDSANTGSDTTLLTTSGSGEALAGVGDGGGLSGTSGAAVGVRGHNSVTEPSTFEDFTNNTGVMGTAGDTPFMSPNTDETGVYGYANLSPSSSGVWGESTEGAGVIGTGDTGVYGSGYFGVYAYGRVGVTGDVDTTSTGVYGFVGAALAPTPTPGVAVEARSASTAQIALNVLGRVKFNRSGRTYVATNASSRKITMAGVSTSSYIIATLQTRRSGVYVHAVVPAAGYFTIYLNKAVTANTYVGYLVIN
jgi:hypothetical protein